MSKTTDWIDYSINYRKYSKECCEKHGIKEPAKPEQPKYPNKDSAEYIYYCNFYNNGGRAR